MFSLSNVNQYHYAKIRVSSLVTHRILEHVVMGSNPGQVNFLPLHEAAILLFTLYKNYCTKVVYSPKTYNYTSLYGPIIRDVSAD